ncbi:MFS transporter [Microlunatus ginsengisoli]|uniref:Major facilitator superfamily (MFS) profile domain-containing protein n=1 Tax=Microlunatus ginsengisoli TaxID=363863 RepID=A0ABP6ZH42_9ACTN
MATTESTVKTEGPLDLIQAGERKPPLTRTNIMVMTLGFFGNSFGFGIVFSAVNPLFTFIGASPEELPILNIAGPITGLFVQPLIGAVSDKTWSDRWGRRKPFIYAGALLAALVLIIFPFVGVLWAAVLCLWLLDIGNNTTAEPYRAFLSDRLPKNQLARGFLTQSFYAGLGAVLANLAIFALQKFVTGEGGNGLPYWMYVCFWMGTISVLVTVLIAMRKGPAELRPDDEELAEIKAAPKGLLVTFKDIAGAVRTMPVAMHKIGAVFFFQWYAMFIYWQFVAISLGETVFNSSPEAGGEAWEKTVSWAGLENATYNFFTMLAALFLIGWCQRVGAKKVQAFCLGLAAISLVSLSQIGNQYLALVPMIGLGIAWASMIGLPSMMVSTLVPKKQTGVYLGILNTMIVVPMLIETVTFGWIFKNLLGGSGSNAILLAGIMLACGGICMLWVNPPPEDEESPLIPLGAPRHIKSVYDEVIVGSDGSPTSLVTIGHAAGIAHAAEARLVVVTAYNSGGAQRTPAASYAPDAHQMLYGKDAADLAMQVSLRALSTSPEHNIKELVERIVPAEPAQALLDAAGDNPKNLIVVGNRGLGAAEGELLGSVPAEVVKHAVCNVMIVQTTRHAEDLAAMTSIMEIEPGGTGVPATPAG